MHSSSFFFKRGTELPMAHRDTLWYCICSTQKVGVMRDRVTHGTPWYAMILYMQYAKSWGYEGQSYSWHTVIHYDTVYAVRKKLGLNIIKISVRAQVRFTTCTQRYIRLAYCHACADLEGRSGGGGPDPSWNLQSLISPILLEMKKLVIFHICALPQLYVKQNQSYMYLRLDPPPPRKFFWIRACVTYTWPKAYSNYSVL